MSLRTRCYYRCGPPRGRRGLGTYRGGRRPRGTGLGPFDAKVLGTAAPTSTASDGATPELSLSFGGSGLMMMYQFGVAARIARDGRVQRTERTTHLTEVQPNWVLF
mmetsp:Transcript_26484/g.106007  ORF Transcript_26484/g.106007 Transcript_26484/m.106007 type:complete len:106 (+) Transcript_26484:129-446(+)